MKATAAKETPENAGCEIQLKSIFLVLSPFLRLVSNQLKWLSHCDNPVAERAKSNDATLSLYSTQT